MSEEISVDYSKKFLKQASRLPEDVVSEAEKRELIFRANPFDPLLKTHKLHGKEKEVWAFSVTNRHRIKFVFLPGHSVLFLEIGTHDIYK